MASPVSYTPLEPSVAQSLGINGSLFNGGQSFFTSISFLWTLAFSLIVAAAFYRYTIAGIARMQASEAGIRKSNDILKQVTLGLLGVFSLFLLLSMVNKDMLAGDVGLSDLATNPTTGGAVPAAATVTNVVPSKTSPQIPITNDDPTGWSAIQNDAAVRAQLKSLPNGGIGVNKNVCNNPTQPSCTTVGGLPKSTLDMLSQLRNACPGTITVTGGTEAGHSSHGPGKRPVDLAINVPPGLEACIRAFPKSSSIPKRGNGTELCYTGRVYANFGYTFCDEQYSDRHWHVF